MFETKRLRIRKLRTEDAPFVLALMNTEYANEYNAAGPINEAIVWKMVEYQLSYVLVLKDENKIIGLIGAERDFLRYNMKSVSLTYIVDKDYQGQGYMSEALREVLNDLFTRLERRIVSLRIAKDNLKSKNLAEALGFHYDGMIRMGTKKEDGTIYDDLLYSMTKEEYETNMEI